MKKTISQVLVDNDEVRFFEPHPILGADCEVRIKARDAVKFEKECRRKIAPSWIETDEDYFLDFCATHWAEFTDPALKDM